MVFHDCSVNSIMLHFTVELIIVDLPFQARSHLCCALSGRGGRTFFVFVTALYSYLPCIFICYAARGKEANTWFVFVTALYLYLHSICDVQREGKGWVLAGEGGEDLCRHPLQTTGKVPQKLSIKKKAVWSFLSSGLGSTDNFLRRCCPQSAIFFTQLPTWDPQSEQTLWK